MVSRDYFCLRSAVPDMLKIEERLPPHEMFRSENESRQGFTVYLPTLHGTHQKEKIYLSVEGLRSLR